MQIHFHTNLDEAKPFVHHQTNPQSYHLTSWTHVPAVGSCLRFYLGKLTLDYFELEVVSVSYSADGQQCFVELHIPRIPSMSIAEWEKWMRRRLGKE